MGLVDLKNLDQNLLKLGKSGRAVKLFYDKEPLQLCTSTMSIPFGVKSNIKEWATYSEYYVDCFINNSKSEVSQNFKSCVENLDEHIKRLVRENIKMFDSKKETAKEDFVYSSFLRENGTYPKLMKLQFTRDRNGNFESFIFDENKQKIPIDENNIENILCKGKIFKAIIECSKIWYYDGKVGSIWKIVQLKFSEKIVGELDNVNENVYNQLMIMD
jgi:hypothetical protein